MAACNCPNIARDIQVPDWHTAAADIAADRAVAGIAEVGSDKAVVDKVAEPDTAGVVDSCFDTEAAIVAWVEQIDLSAQYPTPARIAELLVAATVTCLLAQEWVPLELALASLKKFLIVCLKNLASWLITYPLLGKILLHLSLLSTIWLKSGKGTNYDCSSPITHNRQYLSDNALRCLCALGFGDIRWRSGSIVGQLGHPRS